MKIWSWEKLTEDLELANIIKNVNLESIQKEWGEGAKEFAA